MAAAPVLLVSADPTRQSCDCLRNVFSVPDVVGNNPKIRLSLNNRKVGLRKIILLLLLMALRVPSQFH